MAEAAGGVAAVVVTYNGLPWIEQCLDSLRGTDTVVVDHGSQDGTVSFVRERYPAVRVVEQENLGLAAGWNRGIAETTGDLVLIVNADAWLVGDALDRLVEVAGRRPGAAWVGPRLIYPDGSLQRSVRGFPTVWRLATEYLFLRKLAPRTRALNAFYGAGFDHRSERTVEWTMGSCMLVRRSALDDVGAVRHRLLPLQRRDRLVPARGRPRLGDGVHARRGLRARRRRRARRSHVSRERPRAPALPAQARGSPRGRARAEAAACLAARARGAVPRLSAARRIATSPTWLGQGDVDALLER